MIYKCLHCVIVQVARVCVHIKPMSSRYFADLIDNSFCIVTCDVQTFDLEKFLHIISR